MKGLRDIGTIHFVGIGGIGMSGIAEVMHNLGYTVQGSAPSAFSTEVTFDESRKVMPCFCRMRWNCLAISASMPGRMRSRNSIT